MPERRCIATGETKGPAEMVRFVVGPDGEIVPDLAGELPGRGIWVSARRDCLELAVKRRLFARAARAEVRVDPDLPLQVERLAARRALDLLGLARRAGLLVAGFEKVRERLQAGRVAVLVQAADAAADGRARIRSGAGELPVVELFSVAELSLALGRENVVHAALAPGSLAQRFLAEAARLRGLRGAAEGRTGRQDRSRYDGSERAR